MSAENGSKQAIPSSITGEIGESPASVLDHKFGTGDPYTLGVEEEYQLLDCETFDLVQHIDTMLEAVTGHELEARINSELMQSVLEISTPVCRNAGDVMRWLTTLRGYVTGIANERDTRVGSSGTHPFSLFERQRITAKDRYRALIDQLQYVARRELIFGMHVHVAVDDPEKAVKVVNGLLPHLAPLLALSASSPFWRGEPTGLASSRQMVFSAFPRSGPPPRFRDYADYAEVVGQLERSGCIADYTHIWWDIRLHPRLGTIEIRICDAVTRVEDAVAIVGKTSVSVSLRANPITSGIFLSAYDLSPTSMRSELTNVTTPARSAKMPSPGERTLIRGASSNRKNTVQALSTQYIVARAPNLSLAHPPSARTTPDGRLKMAAIMPAVARVML